MNTQLNFIVKVLVLSAGVSVLLKYGGALVPVAATSANALIAVLTPSIVLAIALLWRARKDRQDASEGGRGRGGAEGAGGKQSQN